jgi:hypothetical protein
MTEPHFNGPDQDAHHDRLAVQFQRIFDFMLDQKWHTLNGISQETHDPPASVSAQLRHMRKPRFGAHTVERRHLGRGLYEYRLIPNTGTFDGEAALQEWTGEHHG